MVSEPFSEHASTEIDKSAGYRERETGLVQCSTLEPINRRLSGRYVLA